ncbi:MAG TPA: hypothetical protein VK612_05975 [Pyrinomonadaceae bacterium]|nr:hypothetical protein [Pyrinomonadaceae bacterium]
MAAGTAYGVMIDSEATDGKARIKFDIAKFDSDPWVKKDMKWDSDHGLHEGMINYLLDNAVDSKLLTIQLKTTEDTTVYDVLKVANKKKNQAADKEGVLDYFQLNIVIEGMRHSVRFDQPSVEVVKPHSENRINYIIFSVKTKKKVVKDGGPL